MADKALVRLRALIEGIRKLVAPDRCCGCEGLYDGLFCEACRPLLEPLPHGPALYAYGGPLADAIKRMKYGLRSDLGRRLSSLLVDAAERHAGRVDAVIPIPLHSRRLRARGFNQATLLAAPVARVLGVPLCTEQLRRIRPTMAQASLRNAARLDNVRGAFAATALERGSRVLLVDDVRTTGATLREAEAVLYNAGVDEVRMLVLASREI